MGLRNLFGNSKNKSTSCEWCGTEFDSEGKTKFHELDCEMSPSNLQKKESEHTSDWINPYERMDKDKWTKKAIQMEKKTDYNGAIEAYKRIQLHDEVVRITKLMADDKVKHLDYDKAIEIYESIGDKEAAKNARKLKSEEGAVKVDQTVVQGDQITNTEIKDSVLNRSNVGAGGKSKSEELREAKALLDDGIIDDDEFKQMKKEILGK